jgi:hypothetical protein
MCADICGSPDTNKSPQCTRISIDAINPLPPPPPPPPLPTPSPRDIPPVSSMVLPTGPPTTNPTLQVPIPVRVNPYSYSSPPPPLGRASINWMGLVCLQSLFIYFCYCM